MNIWHIIVLKISHAVATVLIFTGLVLPAMPSQTTIVDIQSSDQVNSTNILVPPAITPTIPKIVIKIPALMRLPTTTTTMITSVVESTPTPTILAITPTLEPTPKITMSEPISAPQPIYVPIYIQQLAPAPVIEESITSSTMKSITIISPIRGKGLGREYLSRPEIKDEFNYVELGLIVRDTEGKPVKNLEVIVNSDRDNTQDKTMANTGNVTPIYENGVKIITPYYPFSYHITKPGKHVITFTCDGVTTSIDFIAKPDNRIDGHTR